MQIKDWPDIPFWEEIVKESNESTFYHTPLWHEIVVNTFKDYFIATKGFIFEDGKRAVLPFIQTKTGGFFKGERHLKSSVYGYGGIISEGRLSEAHQNQIYNYITSMKASVSIESNPLYEYTLPDCFSRKRDFIHFIPLDKGEKYIYKHFSKGAKSSLSKAKRKGIIVRTIQKEEELLAYFEIYRDTLKRWGNATRVTYPEELFLNIFKSAGNAAKIWVAEKDGKIIAVVTIFYWNQIVNWFHGAALQDYFDCCPNNILQMEIMKDAIKRNYHYYDLGPSGGIDGVIKFKESFGAEKRELMVGHWKYRWKKRDRFV